MKETIFKRTHFFVLGFLFLYPIMNYAQNEQRARRFKVVELYNCKSIQIGQKKLKENDEFNGGETIHWTHALQMIKFQELKDGKIIPPIYKRTGHDFELQKANSIIDLLTKEISLGHRSTSNNEQYYADVPHYLADSLHIPTKNMAWEEHVAEAIWNLDDGTEVITPITRTPDGKFYVITPAIYKTHTPRDIKLSIREHDVHNNYINNVYRDYPIIYIPRKLKK